MRLFNSILITVFILGLFVAPSTPVVEAQSLSIGIPSGAAITSATLSIYVRQPNQQTVYLHRVTAAWSENEVTWNSFAHAYDPAAISSFTPAAAGWLSVDVKSTVEAWVAGTYANQGFALRQTSVYDAYANYFSSDAANLARRPKLEICYMPMGGDNTCVTIQRSGADPIDVMDSYIRQSQPTTNFGTDELLWTGKESNNEKYSLLRFDFHIDSPAVNIIKYTNGVIADDPNGTDVPVLTPGDPITWTYQVTNTGNVAVPQEDVIVTDDQIGVTPAFDQEITGNGDAIFDPSEIWLYSATGTAVDLLNPPAEVRTYPGMCTDGGEEDPSTAYINQGTVTIPGATDTADSSYCNPPVIPPAPAVEIVKYTNGFTAADPNGVDVPVIPAGGTVVWTYQVTNTGNVAVPLQSVVVTDDQVGVTPAFDHEITGDDNELFDPGEVWLYSATGTAVNLSSPPGEVKTFPGLCTAAGTKDPSTAYINRGTVTIPGATDTADSSYCNPPLELDVLAHYYIPIAWDRWNSTPFEPDIVPFQVTVGYEDLPLLTGINDYDYNDWVIDIQGGVYVDTGNPDLWKQIDFDVTPNGRGATYTHSFFLRFPANTFASDGIATLTIYDQNGQAISTRTFPFVGSVDSAFEIFSNTATVFPADYSNTYETDQRVTAQRSANLSIEFTTPIAFDLSNYQFDSPHGSGLFFDPYLHVLATGDEVHTGDIRMLNVPEDDVPFQWAEERVRIDRAYPNLQFLNGNPPNIIFTANWWETRTNCVIDGATCTH